MTNQLDFCVTEANGLSIELLVNGELIDRLEEGGNRAIPYFYFEDDLPNYFNYFRGRKEFLLGVCSCGESGCGAAGCVVVKDDEYVFFRELFVDGYEFPKDFEFKFARANYDEVVERILSIVNEFKATIE